MVLKIIAGLLAVLLMIGFNGAAAIKLQDPALIIVALIGIAMMAIDLWQSLRSQDD